MNHGTSDRPTTPRRSALPRILAFLAAAGALASHSAAQEFARNIIVPQSRVIVAPDTQRPVRIQRVEATIDIREQVATTTLRVILHNPSGRQQEAEVMMPVPEGAAIRFFQLEGLGGDGGATLLPRDEARKIYEAIVRRMIDPAILEFAGHGMIRSNVFPVPAGEESVIALVYEQVLTADGARIDYVLPRSHEPGGAEWSIKIGIEGSRAPAGVYSPTHDLMVLEGEGRVIPAGGGAPDHRARYEVKDAGGVGGAFRLAILRPPAGDELAATFLAYPDPRVTDGTSTGGYFLMLAGLPAPGRDAPRMPREVTLVIDRSGSMRGEKMAQAIEAATQIVSSLGAGEHFNIIDYASDVTSLASGPIPASRQNIERATGYLRSIQPIGGTNIHDALVTALEQPATEGSLPVVLFLTDGLATIGRTTERAIRDAARSANRHDRRIFTVGVGFDVNTPLLRAIATDTRATATFVLPGEDVEAKVGQVYSRLRGPIFAGPEIALDPAGGGRITGVLPSKLADVFEGEQVLVVGRYIGTTPMTFRLSGAGLDGARTYSVEFDPRTASARSGFVPRLWATRQIGVLLDGIRQNPGSDGMRELVSEIVRLSTEYGILTEYTAFLAADPADMPAGSPLPARPPQAWSAPSADRDDFARRGLERRLNVRDGAASMNQELNNAGRADAMSLAAGQNRYLDERMRTREITTVQQVEERAYFRTGARWVDSAMLEHAASEPESVVAFGTEEYSRLIDELVADNRHAVLANRGEIYLMHRGRRVLVQNPS